jgi:acetyl esterase
MIRTIIYFAVFFCSITSITTEGFAQRRAANQGPRLEPTVANFSYGEHERHVLDFYKADSSTPTPLVMHIHGGGFVRGSKDSLNQETLKQLLKAGISVASIHYRLAGDVPLPAAHEDAERAIQTLRSKADEWNFDKTQMGAFGGSSGAQLSMWLAYQDDQADPTSSDPIARESTRLAYVAPLSGQITNDFDWWLANLPGYDEVHRDKAEIFGTNDKEKIAPIAKKISVINHVSADDPPTYMNYRMAPGDPIPEGDSATTWKVHHVIFGVTLKEKLDALGVEVHLNNPNADSKYKSEAAFFIDKFGK